MTKLKGKRKKEKGKSEVQKFTFASRPNAKHNASTSVFKVTKSRWHEAWIALRVFRGLVITAGEETQCVHR